MEFEMKPYVVYAKLDDVNRITEVNSSAFLRDTDGWTEIDSGYGDKYHHAQGTYFPKQIMDDRGIKRYQAYPFVDAPPGVIIARFFKDGVEYLILERTQEEIDADYAALPALGATQLDRIEAQALYTALMTDTLIEEV